MNPAFASTPLVRLLSQWTPPAPPGAGAGLGWEWEPDGPGVGPALKFSAGKEFAVGNNWGIGFAAYTEYANLPNGSDANGSVRFNALTFGVAFTVSKW